MWLTQWMRRKAQDGPCATTAAPEPEGIVIADFEPRDDALICIWDDSDDSGAAPPVQIERDPARPDMLRVRLGNRVVAQVRGQGALAAADLSVMPLSSALALGFALPEGQALQ